MFLHIPENFCASSTCLSPFKVCCAQTLSTRNCSSLRPSHSRKSRRTCASSTCMFLHIPENLRLFDMIVPFKLYCPNAFSELFPSHSCKSRRTLRLFDMFASFNLCPNAILSELCASSTFVLLQIPKNFAPLRHDRLLQILVSTRCTLGTLRLFDMYVPANP